MENNCHSLTFRFHQMQSALLDMFSVKCKTVGSVSGVYVQDYERGSPGIADGVVINDEEPYCGRRSVRNPFHIYYAGITSKPGSSQTVAPYDVRNNGMVSVETWAQFHRAAKHKNLLSM